MLQGLRNRRRNLLLLLHATSVLAEIVLDMWILRWKVLVAIVVRAESQSLPWDEKSNFTSHQGSLELAV